MQAVRIKMVGLIRVAIGVYVSLNNITVSRRPKGLFGGCFGRLYITHILASRKRHRGYQRNTSHPDPMTRASHMGIRIVIRTLGVW